MIPLTVKRSYLLLFYDTIYNILLCILSMLRLGGNPEEEDSLETESDVMMNLSCWN